ncbi:MAG: hypothetical protein QM790_17550 [Nibricoccus sp.]
MDISKLENVRVRHGKLTARCPACAAKGGDRRGNHLVVYESGCFGCAAFAGDKLHQAEIRGLLGRDLSASDFKARRHVVEAQLVKRGSPRLPDLQTPSLHEVMAIAEKRGFPVFAPIEIARKAGQLFCADMLDGGAVVRAWILTDSARRNAQARRLDGNEWIGIKAKAKTLSGSDASWPIGIAEIASKPTIALCEGGPDLLAVYFFLWWHGRIGEVAPVAMMGAGQRISSEVLPLFRGKHVRVFPHRDEAGTRARSIWGHQLLAAGAASVDDFDCAPEKDLNDLIKRCARSIDDQT